MASIIRTLGLAGAALAAWYFLDPSKGPERRQKVVKSARDAYDNLGPELTRMGNDIASGVTDTVNKVSEMARNMVSSSTDGAAAGTGSERTVPVE